jgi:hypothetical protein
MDKEEERAVPFLLIFQSHALAMTPWLAGAARPQHHIIVRSERPSSSVRSEPN